MTPDANKKACPEFGTLPAAKDILARAVAIRNRELGPQESDDFGNVYPEQVERRIGS